MIDNIKKVDCTGCNACCNVCPKQCISMVADIEGFCYPKVDYNLCISCGMCRKVCPSINPVDTSDNYKEPQIYAAWSLNEEIRINSTSGGIFSELAMQVLEDGGYVCGARYNNQHLVEHCIIDKVEDLAIIRQSKYVQSDIGLVFREIKKLLKDNQRVLFCGTPCECVGLINYLGKKYEKLIIVDFVCRGANAPNIYKMFLEALEEKYQSKVARVWFKNKTYGWNKFSTRIDFENGEVYLENRYSDLYIRGYIEGNLYMRECCSECKYKELPRVSDITLADFWRIVLEDQTKDTDKGTSLIMINSDKGKGLFAEITNRIFLENKSLDDAIRGNMCILKSAKANVNKGDFLEKLDKLNILENIERFCKKR